LNGSKQRAGAYERIEGIDYLDKVIEIDQNPIGRTPRSNPATYTGLFDHIRDVFAMTNEAKMRGYKKGRFSFNVKGGRCEACKGDGILKVEMHFLPDVYVPCEVCKGKRYNRETLQVKYKDKSIADVLDMTVEEGLEFFQNIPKIRKKLETLYDVGLGYIKIGQPSTELSGGEAQRIKLATELSKRATGKTIYILDEPTTGLHSADIHKLIKVLTQLVEGGNTVVVIEHNLDVIKTADYIIDLGPEGGDKGGYIVACGTPEEIAKNDNSYTGMFLRKIL
jgi:excinuclease ABC subunit A